MADEIDVNKVMECWREIAGEQAQQIVMLRAALAKTRRPQPADQDVQGTSPPVPDTN